MKIETRLNEDLQTIIPTYLIQKYNLTEGDIVEWNEDKQGTITIKFKN
jgi:bifunctional DNA-binding transcriptional regulator/antitoxin component of YhaV-PrlF toxin-antitoxin module